jgi:hypothetical protein
MGKIEKSLLAVSAIVAGVLFAPYASSWVSVKSMERDLVIGNSEVIKAGEDDRVKRHVEKLRERDPARDAFHCFRLGDHRFISIGLIAIEVPGVEKNLSKRETKFLQGSGDYITTDADRELAKLVRDYASRYNVEIERLLSERVMRN